MHQLKYKCVNKFTQILCKVREQGILNYLLDGLTTFSGLTWELQCDFLLNYTGQHVKRSQELQQL